MVRGMGGVRDVRGVTSAKDVSDVTDLRDTTADEDEKHDDAVYLYVCFADRRMRRLAIDAGRVA